MKSHERAIAFMVFVLAVVAGVMLVEWLSARKAPSTPACDLKACITFPDDVVKFIDRGDEVRLYLHGTCVADGLVVTCNRRRLGK